MVERELEHEVEEILDEIKLGRNFLLSGGAGSGKTYSLVQLIKEIIAQRPTVQIACVTYTNAAVREIKERVGYNNLIVSTIHDFLWSNIKFFKHELKETLIELLRDNNSPLYKYYSEDTIEALQNSNKPIQYKEYLKIKEGIISHDEVLLLANKMFKNYEKLRDILIDKFQFIFVDEYQDTSPMVIEIFLEFIHNRSKKNIIGFFGDSMQSIYDSGVGDLDEYEELVCVTEILKEQNRRNPQSVIDLANKLRTDGIVQRPSEDLNAPNMRDGRVKEGSVKLLYSKDKSPDDIKNRQEFEEWNFSNGRETKELFLTHNLIAPEAGFGELIKIYDKDPIKKIYTDIKKNIEISENDTFEDVIKNAEYLAKLQKAITDNNIESAYNSIKGIQFSQLKKLFNFSKDNLLDDKKIDKDDEKKKGSKRCPLIKHLYKIESIIHLYKEKRYNEFLRKIDRKIESIDDKKKLRDDVQNIDNPDCTIGEIIRRASESGLCLQDDSFSHFESENSYLFQRVTSVKYNEFRNLFNYLEGMKPFSTQHKTKGAEFNNVFIVLDNGKWNKYNFKFLFTDQRANENVYKRTRKLFYVCCTRAKENLIIYYKTTESEIIENAKELFGEENVINCDT